MEREEALKQARYEKGIFENFEEEVAYLIAKRLVCSVAVLTVLTVL